MKNKDREVILSMCFGDLTYENKSYDAFWFTLGDELVDRVVFLSDDFNSEISDIYVDDVNEHDNILIGKDFSQDQIEEIVHAIVCNEGDGCELENDKVIELAKTSCNNLLLFNFSV